MLDISELIKYANDAKNDKYANDANHTNESRNANYAKCVKITQNTQLMLKLSEFKKHAKIKQIDKTRK